MKLTRPVLALRLSGFETVTEPVRLDGLGGRDRGGGAGGKRDEHLLVLLAERALTLAVKRRENAECSPR